MNGKKLCQHFFIFCFSISSDIPCGSSDSPVSFPIHPAVISSDSEKSLKLPLTETPRLSVNVNRSRSGKLKIPQCYALHNDNN